jgi:transcriptional regulator with XRE-family HTH domain
VDIGARLRALRKGRGYTQEGLAWRARVGAQVIRQIEQGNTTDPRAATLTALAQGLGMPVEALTGGPAPEEIEELLEDFTPEFFEARGVPATEGECDYAVWMIKDLHRVLRGEKSKAAFVPEEADSARVLMLIAYYKQVKGLDSLNLEAVASMMGTAGA